MRTRVIQETKPAGTVAPTIQVHDLTKDYGDVRAVDHLSFTVSPGTVTGFLGPNGSGKTTTLRALLGLVTPTSGSATICGRSYGAIADPLREVGSMLEAAAHPGRTARNHLRIVAAEAGVQRSRVEDMLELVELSSSADRRVGGFSLGMHQRLGLAAALMGDPQVLVLDEPTNGLDPEGIRWLRTFVRALAAQGRTVLLSSHVLAEVAQTVDDVVVIDQGRLVLQAPLSELSGRPSEQRVRVRTAQPQLLAATLADRGMTSTADQAGTLTVSGGEQAAIAQLALDHGILVYEITAEAVSLEETFLELTSSATKEAQR